MWNQLSTTRIPCPIKFNDSQSPYPLSNNCKTILPSPLFWEMSWEEEEPGLITSIGVFEVSSDPELDDEDDELVELVEQDREDSDVSDVTQLNAIFFFNPISLFSESVSWLLLELWRLSSLFLCFFAKWQYDNSTTLSRSNNVAQTETLTTMTNGTSVSFKTPCLATLTRWVIPFYCAKTLMIFHKLVVTHTTKTETNIKNKKKKKLN